MPKPKPAHSLAAALLFTTGQALADTQIVTSIKPLTLLAEGIATENMRITTLVPPGASPHNYNMKPSQRRALDNADAIFWVGPGMETFLGRLLAGEDFRDRTITLATGDESGSTGEQEEEHGHDGHHSHDHHEGEDPHIWLDPGLASNMAETMHKALARLDGVDRAALEQNLKAFNTRLTETEAQVRAKLQPAKDISLFAYHSAFSRFAAHYDLNLEGVLTLNPELSPGARHVADIQGKLQSANHPCLLTEPQFNPQTWEVITKNLEVTFSTWDPLATDIERGADSYFQFQHSIADAVLKCLPEQTEH